MPGVPINPTAVEDQPAVARPAPRATAQEAARPLAEAPWLPRMSPVAALALRRAYAWRAPFALPVRGAAYQVRWDFGAQLAAPAQAYRFQLGPAGGWLFIEALGERELLGAEWAPAMAATVPAALRCALLADILDAPLSALAKFMRRELALLPPGGDAPDPNDLDEINAEATVLRFVVTKAASDVRFHGAVRFDDERFVGLACPAPPPPRALQAHDFDALPVPLHFALGQTELSQQDWASLARGDIIAIESWTSAAQGLGCEASLRGQPGYTLSGVVRGSQLIIDKIQEANVPGESQQDGMVQQAHATQQSNPPQTTASETRPGSGGVAPDTGSPGEMARALDGLAITASFELEQRSMTLRELKALQPGFVIELEQPLNQSIIRILANGALVGHGHLIAIGNKLGVRVAEFSGGA